MRSRVSRTTAAGLTLIFAAAIVTMSLYHRSLIEHTVYDSKFEEKAEITDTTKSTQLNESLYQKDASKLNSDAVQEFKNKKLIDIPLETNFLMPTLRENKAIVSEAQRILLNLLKGIIGSARHVMFFEIATYENKGDPAISAGETMLLRQMNLTVVYYCQTWACTDEAITHAATLSQRYREDDLVVVMQGGGNMVGYHAIDNVRARVLNAFPRLVKILFSQSIWLNNKNHQDLLHCRDIYSNRTNFYMFLRDRQTLKIAQENFEGIHHILAPDMAFGLGMLPRQMPPAFDVLWLKRSDRESQGYTVSPSDTFDTLHTYHVSDFKKDWPSQKGVTDMETVFLITANGLMFMQRGRVVITDRLHGHILATLLDIPHVLLDNPPYLKLSSFHKTWTYGQENAILVNTKEEAIKAAEILLERYKDVLPKIGPYMNTSIWEH